MCMCCVSKRILDIKIDDFLKYEIFSIFNTSKSRIIHNYFHKYEKNQGKEKMINHSYIQN